MNKISKTASYDWRRIALLFFTITLWMFIVFAVTGCSHHDDEKDNLVPTVDAPGVPMNFTVERTPEVTLSATLSWSVPAAGGDPSSYEIYRSTTAGTVFQPANHLISITAVAGKSTYTFVDNAGLTPVDTYWVVSAMNAGGETPTAEVLYKPIGPPGGTGDTGFGNNFAAALIFADDIGIGGVALAGSWTNDLTSLDFDPNTGLRPSATEVTNLAALPVPVTSLPYLDPTTTYTLDGIDYYKQQSVSTWQGQWEKGKADTQHVTAAWGDNLVSQALTANSTIRIEMVLSKTLTAPMTSYWMESLYGTRENEIQGTDGTTYDNMVAFVFASNAHLKIQKLDGSGNPDGAALYDQTLWEGDGPGFLAGEVNVSGNFTYGFVWNLKNEVLPGDITTGKTGTWRLTFSLDPVSPKLTPNNTLIDVATNGVRVSATEVYIDIQVQ